MYKDILREKKEKANWTTEELSRRSGVPVGTINKILNGETVSPRYDTMKALDEAFAESGIDTVQETVAYHVGKVDGGYTLEDYYQLPDDVRAELIDGRFFYLQSPTTTHQGTIGELYFQVRLFISQNNGECQPFIAPLDVQLDCDNKTMVQPDLMIICDKDKVRKDRVYGAPDFVAEVLSPSTKKNDTDLKLLKYKNAGVREYWIVDTDKERLICYFFEEDGLMPNIYTFDSEVPVRIYDGALKIKLA